MWSNPGRLDYKSNIVPKCAARRALYRLALGRLHVSSNARTVTDCRRRAPLFRVCVPNAHASRGMPYGAEASGLALPG
jgi:hypothetical protein